MNKRIPASEPDAPPPSSWRLVNLALGLAAILNFAGSVGLLPNFKLSRWVLAPWLTSSSMEAVPEAIAVIAYIGINLWLPASVLLLLFALGGLHRKIAAPRSRLASVGLTLAWVCNVAEIIALSIAMQKWGGQEGLAAAMLVAGLFLVPAYLVLMVEATTAAVAEFVAIFRYRGSTRTRVPTRLLAWAVVPPMLSVVALLLAPSKPIVLAARENSEFEALCSDVGVRLLEKPVAPVNSVAYDWDPQRISMNPNVGRIEMDESGRILSTGGMGSPRSEEAKKRLELDYTENRRDARYIGKALVSPTPAYYRYQMKDIKEPFLGVEALSADVLAFLDVDKPNELRKAPVKQGAIRYQLTLSDRRSGAMLGVQTYVVDYANLRACGANVGTNISQDAFIYDAIYR